MILHHCILDGARVESNYENCRFINCKKRVKLETLQNHEEFYHVYDCFCNRGYKTLEGLLAHWHSMHTSCAQCAEGIHNVLKDHRNHS